jgi:hypothetical protein
MAIAFWVLLLTGMQQIVFDFSQPTPPRSWTTVDDGVMGGLSAGSFSVSQAGIGVFSGTVSVANNGGFSSIRHVCTPMDASGCTKFTIRLKGDGKHYQFRVKSKTSQYYAYTYEFATNREWQTIEIPFTALAPSFRGRSLNLPPYPGVQLGEIGFLIGNKKAETFRLELAYIAIE